MSSCRWVVVLSLAWACAAHGQAQKTSLDRMDLLPRQGTSDPAITPIYSQIFLYALPDEFKGAGGGIVRKGRYLQQSVLARETPQRWTQMISLAGDEALAFSGRTYPQKMVDDYGAQMKKSCPESFSALPLPGVFVGSYDTAVAVFACGTASGGQSLAVMQMVIKGGMDVYTLEWAVRAAPSRGPLKLEGSEWTDRLRRLAPIRLCSVVANERRRFPVACSGAERVGRIVRIAFVTDIHGNLPALEAVVHDIARRGIPRIVNLGDSLSGPLLPLETARYLMRQDWFQLAGNHERQILSSGAAGRGASDSYARSTLTAAEFDWIASLRPTARVDADLHVCHGTPASDLEHLLETVDPSGFRAASRAEVAARCASVDADLIVCGHSHVPRTMTVGSSSIRAASACRRTRTICRFPARSRTTRPMRATRWPSGSTADGSWT